jgi:hypothetical protein
MLNVRRPSRSLSTHQASSHIPENHLCTARTNRVGGPSLIHVRFAGTLRYANNSSYKTKQPVMIRKECTVGPAVIAELRRIVEDSEIVKEDDNLWPEPDQVGRQEFELVLGDDHISFSTSKIGSLADVEDSK